jgi:N-hydroxyarylamine O-acetyltransferase
MSDIPGAPFDASAYLRRIGMNEPPSADLAGLRALHRAHRVAIPFENLDIQMGKPIRLDLESLQRKLVGARRGGYCFEQNTLFLHALRAFGFEVMPCEARVRPPGSDRITPRTHMVLVVRVEKGSWLVDVGFGGSGPLEPVALTGGPEVAGETDGPQEPQQQHGWSYRMARESGETVLQFLDKEGWRDLYAFVPEPRHPIDFEVGNWYTSTHPASRFVITLSVQITTPDARHILHNLDYRRFTPDGEQTRAIARHELIPLLADTFGIDLPADSRFRALDG